jgi:hypothetical protein
MILLDTDHISILQFDSEAADALKKRLIAAKQPIATTVITLEEQCKSWISRLGRQKTVHDQVPYYSRLIAMFSLRIGKSSTSANRRQPSLSSSESSACELRQRT